MLKDRADIENYKQSRQVSAKGENHSLVLRHLHHLVTYIYDLTEVSRKYKVL